METADYERIRRSYLPRDGVKVLFVGESRPDGGTFFYADDSLLSDYTGRAFAAAYGTDLQGKVFLRAFQQLGCYLEDLCLEPVNQIERGSERARAQRESVPSLARRISTFKPQAVVVVKSDIVTHACHAASLAGYPPLDVTMLPAGGLRKPRSFRHCGEPGATPSLPAFSLAFPSFGWQPEYVAGLVEALTWLGGLGILPETRPDV